MHCQVLQPTIQNSGTIHVCYHHNCFAIISSIACYRFGWCLLSVRLEFTVSLCGVCYQLPVPLLSVESFAHNVVVARQNSSRARRLEMERAVEGTALGRLLLNDVGRGVRRPKLPNTAIAHTACSKGLDGAGNGTTSDQGHGAAEVGTGKQHVKWMSLECARPASCPRRSGTRRQPSKMACAILLC